jgi:hypothetical protein
MNQTYVSPETEVIRFSLEMSVMSPGGSGSNMNEPEEWNPF